MPPELTIHQIERRELRSRWFIALLSLVMVAGLVATWLGLFSFLGVNSAYGTFDGLVTEYFPETDAVDLRLPNLSEVSRMYTEDGTLLSELHDGRNSEPVRFEEIPDSIVYAVLAAEDADFFDHEGIDFESIFSAFLDNLQGITRGGSTITQQVVKQNFVGDDISIQRKITEALYAAELEERFNKEQILEFYLNSVYFGWSAYGVKAASLEFFERPMDQLTIAEAATLAVIIRNPSLYDPRRAVDNASERRDDVIDAMARAEFISEDAAEEAKAQPFLIAEPSDFDSPADHVVAEARRQLLNDPEFFFLGATNEERKQAIFGCPADNEDCEGGGGLSIYVTVDLDLQHKANELLQTWLPVPGDDFTDERGAPTGAIAMIDNHTGAVMVMSSGLPFENEQFDLAVQGRRNPGSAFKPIALTAYLESGGSLQSYWDARSPQRIQCSVPCGPGGSLTWTVRNAGGGGGLMSLFAATQGSVNAVYAQLAVEVGPDRIVDVAHRLGIQSPLDPVYSLALGAGAVSPLELASAYTNFATNGLHAEPYLISRIENSAGEVIYEREVRQTQVIDAAVAAAVRDPMKAVVCCGTARRAIISGLEQAGKTGTHQSFREAWFVGYIPNFTAAVWVGFPDEQTELRNVVINGERYDRVFGGTVPAPIWREFMLMVLDKYEPGSFVDLDTSQYNVRPTTEVPILEGLTQEEATEAIYNAHLNPTVEEVNSIEPEGTVLGSEPETGSVVPHGAGVVVQVSTGIPPFLVVPDVRFLSVAEATTAINEAAAELEIIINVTTTFEDTVNPDLIGVVITSSPGPGGEVQDGGTVTLVVGKEPPPPPPDNNGSGDGG